MGDIRIKVGVGLDANVRTVYRPLIAAAQEAAQQVMRALNTGHKLTLSGLKSTMGQVPEVLAGPYRTAGKRAGDELAKVTLAADREARAQARIAARLERDKERSMAKARRDTERWIRDEVRMVEQGAKAKSAAEERERERMARRTGYWAMRNFSPVTPTLSMGKRMAGDLSRGAGVNLDAGAMVSNYVNRSKMAVELSNAAHIENGSLASAKKKVSHKDLLAEANQTAIDTGGDATEILGGMQAFVGKTGDLATARAIMGDMAKLSKATGSSMGDMLDASADVSNALGDIPNKGKVIYDTMRAIAGQGQVGAVEIKDMAVNMSKLAAMTGSFKLGKGTSEILSNAGLTDGTSQNVAIMGAMAQAAKAHGGKPTAGTAANASMAFIRDMSNRTSMKRWHEQGLDVFNDKQQTQIKDPKELILSVLNKTRGNLGQIANLMPNQNSRSVLNAFAHEYKQGGDSAEAVAKRNGKTLTSDQRNEAGLKAASAAFNDYLKVTMSQKEVGEKFAAVMETDAAKAARFQAQMQALADTTSSKLLPAMEKLAPLVAQGAEAFGKFLVWAVGNPGQAVATALSASIAKASLDNVIRTGIEKLMAVDNGKGKGISGAAGALGATLTIAAVAITTAQIGMAYIDSVSKKEEQRVSNNAVGGVQGTGIATHIEKSGTYTKEEKAELQRQLEAARARKKDLQDNPINGSVGAIIASNFSKEAKENYDREQLRAQQQANDTLQRLERVMWKIEQKKVGEVFGPPKPPEGMSPVPAVVK